MSKKFKLGVVGDPIEHSLSPFIHSRFSRNENVNINYLAYKVNNDDFDIFIKEFFQDKEARGLNITLPHKKKTKGNEKMTIIAVFFFRTPFFAGCRA